MKLKKHFDIIIANPPYGKIGAQITKRILEEVDYKQYINLLPANDYKRVQDLWNYVISMTPVKDGFADAAVTTHIADISKNKVNDWTIDEYERSNYIDRQLNKYFEENSKRKHYAMTKYDNVRWHATKLSNKTTFILGWRLIVNKRIAKSNETAMYKWNIEKSIDGQYLVDNYGKTLHGKKNGEVCYDSFTFDTEIENTNFTTFMYSADGKAFMSKLWTSMSVDGGTWKEKWMPKVDWTRPWTVEEILRDYNYTEEEIKEVMSDLNNFRGMESE